MNKLRIPVTIGFLIVTTVLISGCFVALPLIKADSGFTSTLFESSVPPMPDVGESESGDTLYSSADTASADMEVSGPVTIETDESGGIKTIKFTLVLAAGASPVDLSTASYTVSTPASFHPLTSSQVTTHWHNSNTNNILERGEIVEIGISGAPARSIQPNQSFTIEVKPEKGSLLPIIRYAPLSFRANSFYEVY